MRSGAITSATRRNYTGQQLDETGLLFYNARYYDPTLARFVRADTVVPDYADPQDLNRYTYAKNNPIRYTDPTGHCAIICTALIGATIGAAVSYGTQVAANIHQNGFDTQAFTHVDGAQIAASAVTGAIAGATFGVGTAVMGTGLAGTVAAGAISGAVSGQVGRAADNVVAGEQITTGLGNVQDIATDAMIGAAGAAIGYGIAKGISESPRMMDPGKLRPNPADPFTTNPSPTQQAYHRNYIQQYGQIDGPIEAHVVGNRLEIENGHHRWEAAQRMGLRKVPVIVNRYPPPNYSPYGVGGMSATTSINNER